MTAKRVRNKKYDKRYLEERPWRITYKNIITRCGINGSYYKKGIYANITPQELKKLWFRDKAYLMKKPSIDRIDNKKGYTFNNCQYIEIIDNVIKGNLHRMKLSEDDVIFIRNCNLKQKDIAKMFGICPSNVSRIKRKERWSRI